MVTSPTQACQEPFRIGRIRGTDLIPPGASDVTSSNNLALRYDTKGAENMIAFLDVVDLQSSGEGASDSYIYAIRLWNCFIRRVIIYISSTNEASAPFG